MTIKYIKSLTKYELISDGSVIFGKTNGKKVVEFIAKKEDLVIEEGTTIIDKYALANIRHLRRVFLPSTLTEIQEFAFRNCLELEEVHCSSPLVDVKSSAFKNNSKLTTIDMNMRIKNDDIFNVYSATTAPKTSKNLKTFKLANVENGVLKVVTYHRDEQGKKVNFVQGETSTMGFNENTREVFELPQQ